MGVDSSNVWYEVRVAVDVACKGSSILMAGMVCVKVVIVVVLVMMVVVVMVTGVMFRIRDGRGSSYGVGGNDDYHRAGGSCVCSGSGARSAG